MRLAATALAGSLLLASACSGPESVKQAKGKVDLFHRQLDRADYEAIWRDTSEDMRASGSKEDFVRMLTAIHTKLGKVRKSEQTGWRANVNTSGSFAELTMQTTFEKGTGEENFVFRNGDAGQKLAGYHINSMDMMLR